MGFLQKVPKNKEPYEALGAKNGCLAAPFVYLIAGFVVLPSVAFLSLVIVLRESLAAWGGFIIIMGVVLWVLTLIVGAWAYVAGKRADSQRAPEAHNHYFVGAGTGGAGETAGGKMPEPTVTIEKPEPKSLPLGGVPWVLAGRGSGKKKAVGTIRKRA